ncbi:hypothetical protein BS47DRAFT_1349751 [Hydnum rufescens UP504]|uniref:Uncharacterized protein n=1 Tax=Hydnum rufescens UP504 TaxID=1448309 RepID=A0A9P6DRZ4_9AGAM|nr:hypothetical protein BS47DRAFT_1349751 [Hydnum rufescens UP504]
MAEWRSRSSKRSDPGVPDKGARYSTGRGLTKSLPVESPDALRDRNKNKKNLEDAVERTKKTSAEDG